MNFLLIFIAVTGIFDYLEEDETTIMKKLKFILCFFTLIPVLYIILINLRSPKTIILCAIRETLNSAFPKFLNHCENYIHNNDLDNIREKLNISRKNILNIFNTCAEDGKPDKIKVERYFIYDYYDYKYEMEKLDLNNFSKLIHIKYENSDNFKKLEDNKEINNNGNIHYLNNSYINFYYTNILGEIKKSSIYENSINVISLENNYRLIIHPVGNDITYFYKIKSPCEFKDEFYFYRNDYYAQTNKNLSDKKSFFEKIFGFKFFDKYIHKISKMDYLKYNICRYKGEFFDIGIWFNNHLIKEHDILNYIYYKKKIKNLNEENRYKIIDTFNKENIFMINGLMDEQKLRSTSKSFCFIIDNPYEINYLNETLNILYDYIFYDKLYVEKNKDYIKIDYNYVIEKLENYNPEMLNLSFQKFNNLVCRVL